ncbi:hypothetical protein [Gemmata sp.]|uniref:hypothetical protein n=1 Tax=Gemmata sp. TaxID=1914242 RepID=UPI003F7062F6
MTPEPPAPQPEKIQRFEVLGRAPTVPGHDPTPPPADARPSRPRPPVVNDAYGDPLPPGAVLRLGTERGRPPRGWNRALLLPAGDRVLARHALEQPHSLQHFTLYRATDLTPVGPPLLAETSPGRELGDPLSVSADGRRAVCLDLKEFEVHDLTTGKRLLRVPRPPQWSVSLSADGRRLAVGGSYKERPGDAPVECAVWDVDTGAVASRVVVVQNEVAIATLSPDGRTLVTTGSHAGGKGAGPTASPDQVTQIWDVESKAELARVDWPRSRTVVFAPDSKTVAVGESYPAQLFLADARTGKTLRTMDIKPTEGGRVAFSRDGMEVAAVSTVGAVRWDVATGRRLGATPRPADLPASVPVYGAAYDASGRLVAFGTEYLRAFTWDAGAGVVLSPVGSGHDAAVRGVAFTADGTEVRTVAGDGLVYRWSADGKPVGRFDLRKPGGPPVGLPLLSAGGRHVVTETALWAVDAGTVTDLRPAAKPLPSVPAAVPAADGDRVAVLSRPTADKPGWCRVFDAKAGTVTTEVPVPTGASPPVAAVRGDRLAVAYTVPNGTRHDAVVTGWALPDGRKLGEFTLPNGGGVGPGSLAFVGDRRTVVATGFGHVAVVDLETGQKVRDVPDPVRVACFAVAASPDGRLVAVGHTARYERAVRVYDTADGSVRAILSGPDVYRPPVFADRAPWPPAGAMAFSPDGTRLAVPELTSVVVWDLARLAEK